MKDDLMGDKRDNIRDSMADRLKTSRRDAILGKTSKSGPVATVENLLCYKLCHSPRRDAGVRMENKTPSGKLIKLGGSSSRRLKTENPKKRFVRSRNLSHLRVGRKKQSKLLANSCFMQTRPCLSPE